MLSPLKHFRRSNGVNTVKIEGLSSRGAFHRILEKERYRSDRSDHLYSLLVFALPAGSNGTRSTQ